MTIHETISKPENHNWIKASEHELRPSLLGELHARPFVPVTVPRHFFHYAFIVDETEKQQGRQEMQLQAQSCGDTSAVIENKFWQADISGWDLRWEEHTEFMTYRWGCKPMSDNIFSQSPDFTFTPPGKLLVAVQLHIVKDEDFNGQIQDYFNPNSLCVIETFGGNALVATDFQLDPTGHVRFLIIDKGLGNFRAGTLIQRILEIETYRTLALIGLPIARAAAPEVKRIENDLADITNRISKTEDMEQNHKLLNRLTSLAAELEAQVADIAFRFGAGRAYFDIVIARLNAVEETRIPGYISFTNFFSRGLESAIATCNAIEKRQNDLSQRLVRTAELLRTRIQFELEHQNRDVLQSMNRRAKLQLRLQQTVEGLSVIAISYYAVGLLSYIYKGLNLPDTAPSPKLLTAISVPFILALAWGTTRYIRKKLHE